MQKQVGDIDLTEKDYMNIPKYFLTYDELIYAIKFSTGSVRVCLSKKIKGGYAIIIATVSKSRDAIQFKNMMVGSEEKYQSEYYDKYKKRNRTNTGGSESSNISPHDETVSNNSILDNSGFVNSFSKKSRKESRKPEHYEGDISADEISNVLGLADEWNAFQAKRKAAADSVPKTPNRPSDQMAKLREQYFPGKTKRPPEKEGRKCYVAYI